MEQWKNILEKLVSFQYKENFFQIIECESGLGAASRSELQGGLSRSSREPPVGDVLGVFRLALERQVVWGGLASGGGCLSEQYGLSFLCSHSAVFSPYHPLAPGWESGEHKYHRLPTSEVLQGHCICRWANLKRTWILGKDRRFSEML